MMCGTNHVRTGDMKRGLFGETNHDDDSKIV